MAQFGIADGAAQISQRDVLAHGRVVVDRLQKQHGEAAAQVRVHAVPLHGTRVGVVKPRQELVTWRKRRLSRNRGGGAAATA